MKKSVLKAIATVSALALTLSACGGASTGGDTESTSAGGPAASGGGDVLYNVGILQLVQHPALDAATEGFTDALVEEFGDQVYVDLQNAANETAQCATIANGFVSQNMDLIMANATPALQAAAAATDSIPVIGTSITHYGTALDISEEDWTGSTGMNISGASDLAPLDQQADMLEEFFPASTHSKVGILYCSAEPNSKYQSTLITGYLEEKGYTVTEYTFADSNDVASVTQTACDGSDVIYIPTDNTAANCTENINNVALPAGVPIVAGEEGICSGCGVVTLSISYYDMGYEAGLMAVDILKNGTDPSTMDISFVKSVTKKYDAARCEELGVSVPDDYEEIVTE